MSSNAAKLGHVGWWSHISSTLENEVLYSPCLPPSSPVKIILDSTLSSHSLPLKCLLRRSGGLKLDRFYMSPHAVVHLLKSRLFLWPDASLDTPSRHSPSSEFSTSVLYITLMSIAPPGEYLWCARPFPHVTSRCFLSVFLTDCRLNHGIKCQISASPASGAANSGP